MDYLPPELTFHVCKYIDDVYIILHLFGWDYYFDKVSKRLSQCLCCQFKEINVLFEQDDININQFSVYQIIRGGYNYAKHNGEFDDYTKTCTIHHYEYEGKPETHTYNVRYFVLAQEAYGDLYGFEFDTLADCLEKYHTIMRDCDISSDRIISDGGEHLDSWAYPGTDNFDDPYTVLRPLIISDDEPHRFTFVTKAEYDEYYKCNGENLELFNDYMDQGFGTISDNIIKILDFDFEYIQYPNEESVFASENDLVSIQ